MELVIGDNILPWVMSYLILCVRNLSLCLGNQVGRGIPAWLPAQTQAQLLFYSQKWVGERRGTIPFCPVAAGDGEMVLGKTMDVWGVHRGVTRGTLGTGTLVGPRFQLCPTPGPGCGCTGTNTDPRGCSVPPAQPHLISAALNVTASPKVGLETAMEG